MSDTKVETLTLHLDDGQLAELKLKVTSLTALLDLQTQRDEAVARAKAMEISFAALDSDGHQWSSRPCATCRAISSLIGRKFGCYAYAAKRGKDI